MSDQGTYSAMQQKNEWIKPSVLFSVLNLLVLGVLALNFYYGQEAAARDRIIKIETQLEFYVLPTLKRIENAVRTP